MNNPSEILVAAGGTVTIDTEEYRHLVENTAYLSMILSFTHDPKSYILSDVCCMAEDLIKNRVQVINAEEEPQEDSPVERGRTDEVASAE